MNDTPNQDREGLREAKRIMRSVIVAYSRREIDQGRLLLAKLTELCKKSPRATAYRADALERIEAILARHGFRLPSPDQSPEDESNTPSA